ncbi:SMC2 [Trypoxylus dichotomus]
MNIDLIFPSLQLTKTKLKDLEEKLKEQVKYEAEVNAVDQAAVESVNSEERNIKQLQKNLKIDENALKTKEQDLAKVNDLYETLKSNEASDAEALAACQKKYEVTCAGMEVNDSGQAETLMSQLMSAKQELMQLDTDMQVSQSELEYAQKQLKIKEHSLGGETASYAQDKAELANLENEIKNIKNRLNTLKYSEEHMNQLQERKQLLSTEMKNLKDNTERFYASKPHTRFVYTDPDPNFNRKNVHGVTCDLIEVRGKTNCIAIETAAGSMYQKNWPPHYNYNNGINENCY